MVIVCAFLSKLMGKWFLRSQLFYCRIFAINAPFELHTPMHIGNVIHRYKGCLNSLHILSFNFHFFLSLSLSLSLWVVSRAMCHYCHIYPTITLSMMILANRQWRILLSNPAENNKLNASFDIYIHHSYSKPLEVLSLDNLLVPLV